MPGQETFCAQFADPNADVKIQSSDGVIFMLHSINLFVHSSSFPGPDVRPADECVQLQEDSQILQMLFEYVYPERPRELDDLPFGKLAALAEAAEKYQIYAAAAVCRLHMRDNIDAYPVEVLAYAIKHGYTEMADRAAPLTLSSKLGTISAALGPFDFEAWVHYRENWLELLLRFPGSQLSETLHQRPHHQPQQCPARWLSFRLDVAHKLREKLSDFHNLNIVFERAASSNLQFCRACQNDGDDWKIQLNEAMLGLPTFTAVTRQIRRTTS